MGFPTPLFESGTLNHSDTSPQPSIGTVRAVARRWHSYNRLRSDRLVGRGRRTGNAVDGVTRLEGSNPSRSARLLRCIPGLTKTLGFSQGTCRIV